MLSGTGRPRCSYALSVSTRPRGVRLIRPCWSRYGSKTSSIVSASSPIATASVESPTGPPANLVAHQLEELSGRGGRGPTRSTSSNSSASEDELANRRGHGPLTSAKSRTRRNSRFTTRGVPRERLAISSAPVLARRRCRGSRRSAGRSERGPPRVVVLEPVRDAEAVAERRCQQTGSQIVTPYQRERRQVQGHGARACSLAEDDRQAAVLHRGIEGLLHRPA